MARVMKKFSAGGAQGKYDRRMADIKKDFTKDSAGKSGRALEVLEAKRAQRIADAEDDRAKRTGADRTATRAAERLAESNLTKTRKYGAAQSVTKDTAGPTGKVTDTLGAITTPKSGIKPQSRREAFNEAFRAARKDPEAMKRGVFTFNGEKFSTKMAGEGRKASSTTTAAKTPATAVKTPATAVKTPATAVTPAPRAPASSDTVAILQAQRIAREKAAKDRQAAKDKAAKGEAAKNTNRFTARNIQSAYGAAGVKLAKGGAVKKKETTMKYRSGGSTPPKPTAADRAADAKFRKSIKNLKPTPEQAAAIGRGNRSSGYAKGGKVKKMAVGGMSTMPPAATNTAPPAANTAARATTPSPAANTAPLATAARATTPPPAATAGPGMSATTQGTNAQRVAQNAQAILQAKYSSATPNRAGSNTNTYTKDAAGNVIGVQTNKNFDRNQALRDFSTVSSNFLKQGVPLKELTRASGELRKLQMDNRSTPAQHQAAVQSILARMNSLVPKKAAKGGSMKAATKSGRALVKKSADTEGRAMKKFAAGGLTSGHKAANGVAKKGLTKGKQIKMNKGGACYAKGGSVRGIDGIATKGKTRCKGARK